MVTVAAAGKFVLLLYVICFLAEGTHIYSNKEVEEEKRLGMLDVREEELLRGVSDQEELLRELNRVQQDDEEVPHGDEQEVIDDTQADDVQGVIDDSQTDDEQEVIDDSQVGEEQEVTDYSQADDEQEVIDDGQEGDTVIRPPGLLRMWSTCQLEHCKWTKWSEWSYCSHPCGGTGTQSRSRQILAHEKCGGLPCSGPSVERRHCNRFCLNGGYLLGEKCECTSEFRGICCHKAAEWKLLFRATPGGGVVSPWHLWMSNLTMNPGQRALQTTANLPKGVYKSPLAENWSYSRVKLAFYTGGEQVAYTIFNASTSKTAWFSKANIIDSTYSDVKTDASTISLTAQYCLRRFDIFKYRIVYTSSSYCRKNTGWMMVEDLGSIHSASHCKCSFDTTAINQIPVFLYSTEPDPKAKHRRLATSYASPYMKKAEVMTIFAE